MSGKFLRRWVDSDDEDSDESASPPWRLDWTKSASQRVRLGDWASFAHRLVLRQELRDKHYMTRKRQDAFIWARGRNLIRLLTYGRLLQALAKGEHPLSTMDRADFYLTFVTKGKVESHMFFPTMHDALR